MRDKKVVKVGGRCVDTHTVFVASPASTLLP